MQKHWAESHKLGIKPALKSNQFFFLFFSIQRPSQAMLSQLTKLLYNIIGKYAKRFCYQKKFCPSALKYFFNGGLFDNNPYLGHPNLLTYAKTFGRKP